MKAWRGWVEQSAPGELCWQETVDMNKASGGGNCVVAATDRGVPIARAESILIRRAGKISSKIGHRKATVFATNSSDFQKLFADLESSCQKLSLGAADQPPWPVYFPNGPPTSPGRTRPDALR